MPKKNAIGSKYNSIEKHKMTENENKISITAKLYDQKRFKLHP